MFLFPAEDRETDYEYEGSENEEEQQNGRQEPRS